MSCYPCCVCGHPRSSFSGLGLPSFRALGLLTKLFCQGLGNISFWGLEFACQYLLVGFGFATCCLVLSFAVQHFRDWGLPAPYRLVASGHSRFFASLRPSFPKWCLLFWKCFFLGCGCFPNRSSLISIVYSESFLAGQSCKRNYALEWFLYQQHR